MASAQTLVQHGEASWTLAPIAVFDRMRLLAWSGNMLYASRGYSLLSAKIASDEIGWREVASFRPPWWRSLTAYSRLASRFARDGFHALAVLASGHLVAAVPGAIITLSPGDEEFRVTHPITRGTRPLHLCAVPGGAVFFGEYFDNPERDDVHIYASTDNGSTWSVVYTFPQGAIRHVHNIVFDRWQNCLWILTGDNAHECQILRASSDLKSVETVLSGNQQSRAVAAVPTQEGLYFSSDTPLEANHVHLLDRSGTLSVLGDLPSSSIYGCAAGGAIFFSTMVEPSEVNLTNEVFVHGSQQGSPWDKKLSWQKDRWPGTYFQYGNAFLPDGDNQTDMLAVSTIAVRHADLQTSIWRIVP
jgi:hypothetical protein